LCLSRFNRGDEAGEIVDDLQSAGRGLGESVRASAGSQFRSRTHDRSRGSFVVNVTGAHEALGGRKGANGMSERPSRDDAFTQYVHARGAALRRTAVHLCAGDEAAADDLLQNTLMRVYRS